MPLYEMTPNAFRPITQASFANMRVRERDDLQRLLRTQIEVLSDDLYVLAEEFGDWEDTFRQPMQESRLLVLSPFAYGNPSRPSTESCGLRNRFVLGFAKDRYLPHGADGMNDAPGFSPN